MNDANERAVVHDNDFFDLLILPKDTIPSLGAEVL